MRKILWGVAMLTALMCAIPAEAREKEATTPSGRPEMVFGYTALDQAVVAVQSECMDRGWMVVSQTTNQVVCEIPMGIWQSALTQMLIGNSYSSPPKAFVRMSLAQVGEHTRVQTQSWAETQMAFGQMQHHQYTDDGTYNNALAFLGEAGAQFPIGTTFTARPYLGINGEGATWQNGRRSAYGYRVMTAVERAPGYHWGIRPGDIISKVNNRTFRDENGMDGLMNRQRIGQPMTFTVVREGVEQTFSGVAQGRPTVTMLVRPIDVPADATPVATQLSAHAMGGLEQMRAALAEAAPKVQAAEAAPAESELDRARREARDAQEKLAALEANAGASTVITPAATSDRLPSDEGPGGSVSLRNP